MRHFHELRDHAEKHKEKVLKHHAHGGKHTDEAADKKLIAKAIAQHEAHEHKGEPKTKLHLKSGGHAEGKHKAKRLDRPEKRADGGRMAKKKAGTHVNVIVGGPHGATAPAPMLTPGLAGMAPTMMPPAGAPPAMPPRPPMMPPGPPMGLGAPPMGGVLPMRKCGGRMKMHGGRMAAGAGSGVGRLQK